MSLVTRNIFKKLNESENVKKPYGDKPQEGKKENLVRGKRVSVPRSKDTPKYKVEKLTSVNKQAGEIYKSDTDKVMDRIDKSEHSDKGKLANRNTKKAERTVKFPYGDKVQKSDSKLVKESAKLKYSRKLKEGAKCKNCGKKVCECDKAKLTESDANQNFLNDYCELLKKYCRTDVKELTLADDTEKVVVTYSNGATKTINIAADSNLAAIKDIANFLSND